MTSLFPPKVERDRAVTGSGGGRPQCRRDAHTRCGSVMEFVIGGNGGEYSLCSLVVTQLDTQDRRLDENRMLSHGRSVIVHYERESQPDCFLATR